jgi:uncharacterized protein (TIGR00266 family)
MKYKITGDNLQMVTLEIDPNDLVYAEAGAMVYMSGNVYMEAKARGGLWKGFKRTLMGETFFLTEFYAHGGPGLVSFAGNAPGTIKALHLTPGRDFLVQKDAFLCAEYSIDLDIAFQQRLGAGFFGGEGFIIQRLFGQGLVFIHACGDFIEMDLRPGQVLKVDTGCVVGWEPSVAYDIQRVGGIKTVFFGGEGLFLTTLTGPGKVLLQSMTLHNLAMALSPFMARRNQTSSPRGFGFES